MVDIYQPPVWEGVLAYEGNEEATLRHRPNFACKLLKLAHLNLIVILLYISISFS